MSAGKFTSRFSSGSENVHKQQELLLKKFIDVVHEYDTEIATALTDLLEIVEGTPDRRERDAKYRDIEARFAANLEKQIRFMETYAKMLDIGKRSRKVSNAEVFREQKYGQSADSFSYVFEKAHRERVTPAELAGFFRTNAMAMFSLTAHPTNSTSLAYTEAGLRLDAALGANLDATEALRSIYNTAISGEKKTQEEEVRETIGILDNIYNVPAELNRRIDAKLNEYPAYRVAIDSSKPFIEPCIWATGDGDGNDNATAQTLSRAIELLRARIKELYLKDLQKIAGTEAIREKLSDGLYASPQELLTDLKTVRETDGLQCKVRTFGFHYAKIDIRHNSEDIMLTMANVASKLGLMAKDDFLKLPEKEQETKITQWLTDESLAPLFASIDAETLTHEKARNIFARLQVIGQNPEMSDKFIIAETKSSANALAALLLLKATRPAGAAINMDVVTLSESVPDLQALPGIVTDLLANPVYRAHVQARGCVMPMIAKSDTTRRHGIGAVTEQEAGLGKVYKIVEDAFGGAVTVKGYNGGGCALQRGGGNVTEVPHNIGRAVRRHGGTRMGPTTLTIQGVQMQVLLSPGISSMQTIEALASQNLYAAMQTATRNNGTHFLQPRTVPASVVNEVRRETGRLSLTPEEVQGTQLDAFDAVCGKVRDAYFGYIGDPDQKDERGAPLSPGNPAFNELFKRGPWVSVSFGNLSSRPAKRGAASAGNTVEGVKGKNPVLLDNRAITVERNSGHSGTHFLTYLGLLEGFKALSAEQSHRIYESSKTCRDLMRNTATSLHMTDFETSWRMMIGQEHPDASEIQILADNFKLRHQSGPAPVPTGAEELEQYNKETLAFIETYAMEVAKCVCRCVLGVEPHTREFNLKEPLQAAWPDLAKQLESRERMEEFAHSIEARLTDGMNRNPKMEITPGLKRMVQSVYCACDVASNAPEGMMNTVTTMLPERQATIGR